MRTHIVLAGLVLVAAGQVAFSAETASKPVLVASATAKQATKASASRVNRENPVAEGSLEAFGSVGLPQ
jgi:hypothetical protein